jgi:hypothetical protein
VNGVDAIDVGATGACAACAVALGVDPLIAPIAAAGIAAMLRAIGLLVARKRKKVKDGA